MPKALTGAWRYSKLGSEMTKVQSGNAHTSVTNPLQSRRQENCKPGSVWHIVRDSANETGVLLPKFVSEQGAETPSAEPNRILQSIDLAPSTATPRRGATAAPEGTQARSSGALAPTAVWRC